MVNISGLQVAGASDTETADAAGATTRASACLCDPEESQVGLAAYNGQESEAQPGSFEPKNPAGSPGRSQSQHRSDDEPKQQDPAAAVPGVAALLLQPHPHPHPHAWLNQQQQPHQHQLNQGPEPLVPEPFGPDPGAAAPKPGHKQRHSKQTASPPPPSLLPSQPQPPAQYFPRDREEEGDGDGEVDGKKVGMKDVDVGGDGDEQPRQQLRKRSLASHDEPLLLASGGDGAWVDPDTMWTTVQKNGEELQRRRRLLQARPASSSCVGSDWTRGLRRFLQRARTQVIVTSRVAAKDPWTVVVPLFLLVCMLAFGLWGVFSVSYAIRDGRRQAALNAALDYSNTLKSHIAATVAPASTVKTLIQRDPTWDSISSVFYDVAPDLVLKGRQSDAILTIVLAPQGIAQAIVPRDLPGWDKVVGLDLLRNMSWRKDALKTVRLHEQGMVMTGPTKLRAGPMGIVCRYAVFISGAGPEETFGFNGSAFNCSDICYSPGNQTSPSKRFWGFAQLNVDWEVLIHNVTHITDLCERDSLAFNMTYRDPDNVTRTIAHCRRVGADPVVITISTMQNSWNLSVSDIRGWVPSWTPVVLAAVVVVSLWISITMAIILINRREHMWLLQAMLPKKVIATLRRGEEYAEAFECVTVLFSDIVSYTTLASEMEPIKIVRLLNEMYSAFDDLVDQYECYKVETIGDAFMAVCGTQGEDAVAAAVKMAQLAQAMIERTRVLVSVDGQKIQIRIGLHSGPVVGAVVGFKMPHFCLCGDTVNTASRMESNSQPMSIHVSDATAQLLTASNLGFRLEPRGLINVKGKGPMSTHWLLPDAESANAAADRLSTLAVAMDTAAAAALTEPAALPPLTEAADPAAGESGPPVSDEQLSARLATTALTAPLPPQQSTSGALSLLGCGVATPASGNLYDALAVGTAAGSYFNAAAGGQGAGTSARFAGGARPRASDAEPIGSPSEASAAVVHSWLGGSGGAPANAAGTSASASGTSPSAGVGRAAMQGRAAMRVGSGGRGGRSVSLAGGSLPLTSGRRCSELGEPPACAWYGFSFLPRVAAHSQASRAEVSSGTGTARKGRGASVDLRLFQSGSPAPRSKG